MNGGTIGGRSPAVPSLAGALSPAVADGDSGDQRRQQHHARELHDDRRRERDASRRRRCRDHLGDVVDARSDPRSELLVVEPERAAERRQHHDRERPAQRHEGDGERDLVLVCVDDAVRRRDRGDAADREARRDEEGKIIRDAEPPAGPAGAEERDRDDRHHDEERLEAEREDVREHEVEAEQDDTELEHRPCRRPQARSRRRRHAREIRHHDPERDAEDERGKGGERPVGAQRDGNSGTRESEPGRQPDHSSGWRNG